MITIATTWHCFRAFLSAFSRKKIKEGDAYKCPKATPRVTRKGNISKIVREIKNNCDRKNFKSNLDEVLRDMNAYSQLRDTYYLSRGRNVINRIPIKEN